MANYETFVDAVDPPKEGMACCLRNPTLKPRVGVVKENPGFVDDSDAC